MARKTRVFLLVRGLVRGKGHWADFPDFLQPLLDIEHGDKMLFEDLPGNGEHIDLNSPWSMRQNSKILRQNFLSQIRSLNLSDYELVIVAISMGAMAVADWLEQYPTEISKAFFLNTSSAGHAWLLERFNVTATLLNPRYWFSGDAEMVALQATCNHPERIAVCYPLLKPYSDAHTTTHQNGLRQLIAATFYAFPKRPPIENDKIIFLVGGKDRLVNPICSKRIAKAWASPIEIHPTAGHDLSIDAPAWIIEKLQKYLEKP